MKFLIIVQLYVLLATMLIVQYGFVEEIVQVGNMLTLLIDFVNQDVQQILNLLHGQETCLVSLTVQVLCLVRMSRGRAYQTVRI